METPHYGLLLSQQRPHEEGDTPVVGLYPLWKEEGVAALRVTSDEPEKGPEPVPGLSSAFISTQIPASVLNNTPQLNKQKH